MKVLTLHRNSGADGGLAEIWGLQPPSPLPASSLLVVYNALYTAVHTTRKCCSVACSCFGKAVQKLATDVHLDAESP